MPTDWSEIPVSLVLKPRDFVINADDPVVVNYVGGVFEVVFEAGFVKYISVWNSRCVRSLVNIIVTGLRLAHQPSNIAQPRSHTLSDLRRPCIYCSFFRGPEVTPYPRPLS